MKVPVPKSICGIRCVAAATSLTRGAAVSSVGICCEGVGAAVAAALSISLVDSWSSASCSAAQDVNMTHSETSAARGQVLRSGI